MNYQHTKTSRLGNRMSNEDRIGIAEVDGRVLLVLADGMGGYRGGQLASTALVNSMLRQFQQHRQTIAEPSAFLKVLIADAHRAVIRKGVEQYPPVEPRTTCVVCLIQHGHAWWAHVGDSRLYLFRDGSVLSRTRDHSKIESLLAAGKISERELKNHPQRNLVTRCVGDRKRPPISTFSEKTTLEKKDIFLLCSDGLWDALDDDYMAETLQQTTLNKAVDRLAYQAEFRSYPEADNISVIALRWISDESDKPQEDETEEDELTQTLKALNAALERK
ncbi:MAG: protein phosphatase 2C domain-containing protein [Gammaproteobacteria bacterium]|nr:protein phosphatase 2C domain-containing protein [Gammaproteobacteria bacterium]MCF6362293.1 protein phosphatase 2C domain-containing protein [Gammaproteobacteria bacterium]